MTDIVHTPVAADWEREPYKGLQPYEEADQAYFFGRDADRKILVDKILTNKLTLLFAASGIGKSSLLQAAVLPQLKDPKQENLDAVYFRDWVVDPVQELKNRIGEALQKRGHLAAESSLPKEVRAGSLCEFLRFCTLFTRSPFVLVLDQFEEFFQYQRKELGFLACIQQLAEVVTDRELSVALVIAMREDFALELNAFKSYLPTLLFGNYYRLEKLDEKNAELAIVRPIELVGFRYEPTLITALLTDLAVREERSSNAGPVGEVLNAVEPAYLQIICSQLWSLERQNPTKLLRLETYETHGRARGLLRSYVENMLNTLSLSDKRLASQAFDHLITRRGTKMAYTVGDLAGVLEVDARALGQVLEQLYTARILRRQQRQGVLWYELYHDLWSQPLETWNTAFKTAQRNRRAVLLAGALVLAMGLLYAAYDVTINLTNYHLRLSSKEGISDAVELYRGKAGSVDIFSRQHYLAETGYRRAEVEPDKRFTSRPVVEFDQLGHELLGYLPLTKRLAAYWRDGELNDAENLSTASIADTDPVLSREVIGIVGNAKAKRGLEVLAQSLRKLSNVELKQRTVVAMGAGRIDEGLATLTAAIQDPNSDVRWAVAAALGQLSDGRAVDPLLARLSDNNPDVRQAVVAALGKLGDPRAGNLLLARLEDADWNVRLAVVGALGHLGNARAVEPLLARLGDADKDVRLAVVGALGHLGNARAVEPLLARLGDADKDVRLAVVGALGHLGDARVVEPLLARLGDADWNVRLAVVGALGHLRDARVVEPLLARLGDADKDVRLAVVGALDELGDARAVEPLLARLGDADKDVRLAVVGALDELGDARAVEPLLARLRDESESGKVCQAVARVLGELGDARAVGPLLACLGDEDMNVRWAVAVALGQIENARVVERSPDEEYMNVGWAVSRALGELGDARAVGPLLARLGDEDTNVRWAVERVLPSPPGGSVDAQAMELLLARLGDEDTNVRWAVAGALGELGDARAVEPLLARLGDEDTNVRWAVAGALGHLGDARVVEPLLAHLREESGEVCQAVARALGELGDARAVEPLLARLGEEDTNMRRAVARALGELGDARAVEPLLARLGEKDTNMRRAVARALGELGDARAVEPLLARLGEEDTNVRRAVAGALGELGDARAVEPLLARLRDEDKNVRQAVGVALVRLGDVRAEEAFRRLLENPKEPPEVKRAVAVALTALGQPDGQQLLEQQAKSENKRDRHELARVLGAVSTATWGNQLLESLLTDPSKDVRRQAIEALGNRKVRDVAARLVDFTKDSDRTIQFAAITAIATIASPDSIPVLQSIFNNQQLGLPSRLVALTGLRNIGSDSAITILITVAEQEDPVLRGHAYKLLGDLKTPAALPLLSARLAEYKQQVDVWRERRDTARDAVSSAQDKQPSQAEKLSPRPDAYWSFTLAYAIARIDPQGQGVALLAHDLADVREGAWMGLGSVGTVALVKMLEEKRAQSDDPLFRQAAYRAIDEMLTWIESRGGEPARHELEAWLPALEKNPDVDARVEWTTLRLQWEQR